MKKKWKGALIGGIVGFVIGILLGLFVSAGIAVSSLHPETIGVSIIGFLIVIFIMSSLGLMFGYFMKRYKIFVITGLIGVTLQILILLLTYNINIQNKIIYWLSYPGLILIIFIILGVILQRITK